MKKNNFRWHFKYLVPCYHFSTLKQWSTSSLVEINILSYRLCGGFECVLPASEKGKGEQKEIKCRAETQYLFNLYIFTKMMVKQNLTA